MKDQIINGKTWKDDKEMKLKYLYSKRSRASKELKALQWAMVETGGYNSENEDSKYLFGLVNKKEQEYGKIDSRCAELEIEIETHKWRANVT